jgi:hypothetical protein
MKNIPGGEQDRDGWGDKAWYSVMLFLTALAVGLVLIAM